MWLFGKKPRQPEPKVEPEKPKQDLNLQLVLDPVTMKLMVKPKGSASEPVASDETHSSTVHLVQDVKPSTEDIYDAFLSLFTYPQDVNKDRDWLSRWSEALGKPHDRVIVDFVSQGLLRQAGLKEKLGMKVYVTELKATLKERGLKVSGKKDELIDRFIEAAPEEAEGRVSTLGEMIVCTADGSNKARRYQDKMEKRRTVAEQEIRQSLQENRVDDAVQLLERYKRAVPRGDWDEPRKDEIKIVLDIRTVPGLADAEVEVCRIDDAAQLLWYGRLREDNKFSDFAYAQIERKRSIEELRRYAEDEFISGVEILCSDDACRKCRSVANKKYPLDRAPLIPIDGCSKGRCLCTYTPVVD